MSKPMQLFGGSAEGILAECTGCGRVLQVPTTSVTRTSSGYTVPLGIRCPCGNAATEVLDEAKLGSSKLSSVPPAPPAAVPFSKWRSKTVLMVAVTAFIGIVLVWALSKRALRGDASPGDAIRPEFKKAQCGTFYDIYLSEQEAAKLNHDGFKMWHQVASEYLSQIQPMNKVEQQASDALRDYKDMVWSFDYYRRNNDDKAAQALGYAAILRTKAKATLGCSDNKDDYEY